MNAELHRAAADSHIMPTDLGSWAVCRLLSSVPTIAILITVRLKAGIYFTVSQRARDVEIGS